MAKDKTVKFSSKAQERRQVKVRNWIAVSAHFRRAGAMKDRKKEADKKKCRKKVAW